MENYIGRLLENRYEILEIIGTGGMAVVYRALDHRLNRPVAVKILKDDFSRNQEFRRRFHAESQAVAMLSHPNIVSVYDVSRTGDIDYIVMELIEGITLKQYLERKGCLNWRETLHFSLQIAKALEHAHSRGIVHRDIKPHNIMILKDGSIKVADFGIARVGGAQNTLTREALGSVHYISPEQAKGAHVDCRSDLYSLGIVMYEMLTGKTPYDGETPVAVAIQHINGSARLPSELVTGIPLGLEQITMHAMNANPEVRYTTAAEMLRDMEEFRKNPAITFTFGAAGTVPHIEQPQHAAMTRSEAERYAAARNAAAHNAPKPDNRMAEQRRAERAQREKELAEAKRRKSLIIGIIAASAVLLVLVITILIIAPWSSSGTDRDDPSYTGDAADTVRVEKFIGKHRDEIDPDDYPDLVIKFEEEFSDEDEGIVIEQSIDPYKDVKKGRTITLTCSKGPDNSKMPDYVDKYGADVEEALGKLKLGLTVETKTEASETITKGYVIRTEPAAGEKLEKDQTVTLYISLGSDKMPDLAGELKTNADTRLKAMEMDLRPVYYEEESDKVEEGRVVRTEPAANSSLKKGQTINIYVSIGDGKIKVPNVVGYTEQAAVNAMKDAKLEYTIKHEHDPIAAAGTVIRQSPVANEKVKKGTVVEIVISDGPQPTEPPTTTPPVTDTTGVPPTEPPTVIPEEP